MKSARHENQLLPFLLACVLALVLAAAAAVSIDVDAQTTVALILLAVIFALRGIAVRRSADDELQSVLRLVIMLVAVYITLRYLSWRTMYTLSFHDPASYVAALALYAAELYGIALYFLGLFVNVRPLRRDPQPLPADVSALPSVDLFIPTYNEEFDLLETTLLAATQVRYPADKKRVYLLDDGASDQLRNHPDPQRREAAERRHRSLKALCANLGVTYLTRPDNKHAKAGNINAALPQSKGELILFLDADHVPAIDILEKTVGWFLKDPQLFLVQTPHFFISPDPLERNLGMFQKMPSENEMFYSVIQRGLDFWNSAYFCGSAALMRRAPLTEIGGLTTTSVTEDAETSLVLHSKGYRSVYLRTPLVSGLQPNTFADFVRQRVRWAQGMTQIFFLRNPLLQKGLRPWQKLSYLSSTLFWFFGFARIVFILAPTGFLVFGLKIYDANLTEVVIYTLPHVFASLMVTDLIFGKFRWPFISELYEHMLSLFTTIGIGKTVRNLQSPKFVVTPKRSNLDADFISELAKPFYFLMLVTLATLGFGVYRYYALPADVDATIINIGWELVNLMILVGAMGALLERRQRRRVPRVAVNLPAQLLVGSQSIPCGITDLSVTGARITLSKEHRGAIEGVTRMVLRAHSAARGDTCEIPVHNLAPAGAPASDPGDFLFGVRFAAETLQEKAAVVALVHGDSQRWRDYLAHRDRYVGVVRGVAFLIKSGAVHTIQHFHWVVLHGLQVFVVLLGKAVRLLGSALRRALFG